MGKLFETNPFTAVCVITFLAIVFTSCIKAIISEIKR